MKYKAGDKVRIKSLGWYKRERNPSGDIAIGDTFFRDFMSRFCGSVVTIESIELVADLMCYKIKEDGRRYCWVDEMIEGLVEEPTVFDGKEFLSRLANIELPSGTTKIWECPDGYIFKDENGNVINTTKIVLEKKKKEYPKTYKECCKVMNYCCNPVATKTTHKEELIRRFQFLLLYRDAYWKIAGEEMGLGKPWEPDWTDLDQLKYCIWVDVGKFITMTNVRGQHILAFPTVEMRDAFYENFKELIESVKELL